MSRKFKFQTKGVDKAVKRLKKMSNALDDLQQTTEISFNDLFTTDFMIQYTPCSSMDELLQRGGFNVNCQEDFDAIPDDVFDQYISSMTQFNSWEEMKNEAASQYVAKKLKI